MVNGQVVGFRHESKSKDIITVNDKVVEREPLHYYLVNKPAGYMSTPTDEHKRKTVIDLFHPDDLNVRLYPILS